MTIACFNTNNLRGIDPYSRKVYYLDDPVHLLVSCAKLCNAMVLNTKFLDSSPEIICVVKSIDHNFTYQVFGAVAGDCSSMDN